MNKKTFGGRVHEWLAEPDGQTFEYGKWRFWFVAVAGLQFLNAVLTALIYQSFGNVQNYAGAILLGVGGLVGWLALGALHYSGVADRSISRGVSILDSITLLFVIAHFAFLMWAYTDLRTIQSAEAKYEAATEKFNTKADKVSSDNVEIARSGAIIAAENRKAEKLRNDTAYQQRRTVEAGGQIHAPKSDRAGSLSSSLSTSNVELEKPVKPEKTSAKFLEGWGAWIRAANLGELLLCAITLIFIRNASAARNTPRAQALERRAPVEAEPEFPDSIDAEVAENSGLSRRENFTRKKETTKDHGPSNPEGLKRLRATLKDISFRLPGYSFKSRAKGDAVWVLMVKANKGTQETVASAKAKLSILDDAMTMPREAFRGKLEKFLEENGFYENHESIAQGSGPIPLEDRHHGRRSKNQTR